MAELSVSFQHGYGFVHLCILASSRGGINRINKVHFVLHHISLIFSGKASKGSFSHLILHLGFDKSGLRGLFIQTPVPSRATLLLATA
jgi:hypothetical protein